MHTLQCPPNLQLKDIIIQKHDDTELEGNTGDGGIDRLGTVDPFYPFKTLTTYFKHAIEFPTTQNAVRI